MSASNSVDGSPRLRWLVGGTVVAIVTCWAYAPSLPGPFLYDDIFQIENNPALRVLWPPLEPMFGGPPFPRRPLAYYTFAINRVAGGLNPLGFRLVNLGIHLFNGLLAWQTGAAVLRRLRRPTASTDDDQDRYGTTAAISAGCAAAIWLVHPLCSQPVAYIYQRMELLGATAILAAVLCFVRSLEPGHGRIWRFAAVAICGMGMLMKETVVAAPAVILIIDAITGRFPPTGFLVGLGASLRQRPRLYAALFATIGIVVAVVWAQRQAYPELVGGSWTPLEYAATQPLALLRYLQLAFWPDGQCFDYGWKALALGPLSACGWAAVAATAV
jgi:protein O-mannosyl-transferase